MENSKIALLVFLALLVGMFVGNVAGILSQTSKMHREAIEAGFAKYICNEKTGELIFTYKNHTNE